MEQSNTGRHKHSCGPSRLKRQQHDLDSEEGVTNSNQLDGSERDLLNNFDCLTTSSKASFLSSLVTSYLPSELLSPLYLSLQPLLRQDFLSRLPTEISFRILDNLDVCSLAQCLVVSKKWHTAAIADVLSWRKHYHKELWVEEEGEKENEMDKIPIAVHSSFNMQTLATSEERSNRRKQRRQDAQKQYNPYIKQLNASRKTRYMWQRGSPKSFSFHCHETSVITCLQLLDSQRVISASDDGTIRIWCLYTGHCLTSFLGHTGGVWTIHVLGSYLLSGSTDRSCRIWRLATGECLGTLTGHTSTVRCAQLFDIDDADEDRQHYYAVSGSRDNTLRIWDLRSMTEKYVLYGHLSSVRCLAVDQNRHLVVSGSYDCTARVWDLRDGSCLRVLLGHTDRIYSICLQDHLVATGGLDANVHIWDIRTGECLYILEGKKSARTKRCDKDVDRT